MIARAMLAARALGRRSSIVTRARRERSNAALGAPPAAPRRVVTRSVLARAVRGTAASPTATSSARSRSRANAERTAAAVLAR